MQPLAHVLRTLFLCALSASILVSGAAIAESPAAAAAGHPIAIRQTQYTGPSFAGPTTGTPLTEWQACMQYSRIANLSIIGANSSYRSAFLDSSREGTLLNAAMLNKAMADHATLIFDTQLNTVCGNATAIAIKEAELNFTQNIVAQFTFVGNPSSIITGPIILQLTVVTLLIFGTLTGL